MSKQDQIDELREKYRSLGWEIPKNLHKLNVVRLAFLTHDADEEIERLEKEELGEHVGGPEEEPDDGMIDTDPEPAVASRQVLPDALEECAIQLKNAFRLYFRRRMWLVNPDSVNADEPKELKRLAKECVRKAVGCCISGYGDGYERGSRMMYLVDQAITEMRNEFTDTLVATTVMGALMSGRKE